MRSTDRFILALIGPIALTAGQAQADQSANWQAGLLSGPMPCTVSPLQTVDLAAPVAGIIESVAVKPGQRVAKGDVIALFDSATARSELAIADLRAGSTKARDIAQSRLAGLERRLSRLTAASASRSVPAADLEQAQLDVDLARGEVSRESEAIELARLDAERARLLVEKSTVRAPVSGSIGETLIDPGESPTQAPIATIYVTDPMKIETYVPVAVLAGFLQSPAFSAEIAGKSYPITFDHRANVADLSSNTLSVFFHISAAEVLPGLDCKVIAAAPPAPKEP